MPRVDQPDHLWRREGIVRRSTGRERSSLEIKLHLQRRDNLADDSGEEEAIGHGAALLRQGRLDRNWQFMIDHRGVPAHNVSSLGGLDVRREPRQHPQPTQITNAIEPTRARATSRGRRLKGAQLLVIANLRLLEPADHTRPPDCHEQLSDPPNRLLCHRSDQDIKGYRLRSGRIRGHARWLC